MGPIKFEVSRCSVDETGLCEFPGPRPLWYCLAVEPCSAPRVWAISCGFRFKWLARLARIWYEWNWEGPNV